MSNKINLSAADRAMLDQQVAINAPLEADNIAWVSDGGPDPRFLEQPLEWFIGKYVQLYLKVRGPHCDHDHTEHLWVWVTGLAKGTEKLTQPDLPELQGILHNTSVFDPHLQVNTQLEFARSEVMKATDAAGREL